MRPWILLDFAGVVGRHQPEADQHALVAAAGAEPEAFWSAYWGLRDQYDRADVSAAAYWSQVVEAASSQTPDAATIDRLVQLDVASWLHPHEPTVALLGRLREQCRLALLSNAPLELADALDELPWLEAVSPRFYSSRLGCIKPHPEAYKKVAALLGVAPEQCVFIDDRPVNVHGAEAVGMTGIPFTSTPQLELDLAEAVSRMVTTPNRARPDAATRE